MLDEITPIVLTYNESPNIQRTLNGVRWARQIIVVDSYSEDDTLAIVQTFPRVRAFKRRFDTHERQWNYALRETGIATEWVLALDADYVVTESVVRELEKLQPRPDVTGYRAHFVYCIYGYPLRGSAYPPVTVLYRRDKASYEQDGHTQRVITKGIVLDLQTKLLHDDRKPVAHWLRSQDQYARLEAVKLLHANSDILTLTDRLRRTRVIMPFLVFLYCLFVKAAILDGWPGVFYAFQRMLAETLLSLRLLEHRLSVRQPNTSRLD